MEVPEYSATRGHASVAGDMLVSRKAHGERVFYNVSAYVSCRRYDGILKRMCNMNQGGTADNVFMNYSSLAEMDVFCPGRFSFAC